MAGAQKTSQFPAASAAAAADQVPLLQGGVLKRITVSKLVGIPGIGWTAAGETWVYLSFTAATNTVVLTVPSGAIAKYAVGNHIWFKQGGVNKYGTITTVTDTTISIYAPSGYIANAAITDTFYSQLATPPNPDGVAFPIDSGWITPTLTNGWSHGAAPVAFRKKLDGVVYLRGQPTKSPLDATVFMTLPVGFRPAVLRIWTVPGTSANYGKVVVNPDGTCSFPTTPAGGSYGGIDTVSYPVDS